MAKPDKNAWMATFSDLVTLLITFFVLLLTMSTLDSSRLKEMFQYFPGASMNFEGGAFTQPPKSLVEKMRITSRIGQKRWLDEHDTETFQVLTRWLEEQKLTDHMKVVRRQDAFEIHLENTIAFAPGALNLKPQVVPFFKEIKAMLDAQKDVRLRVEVVASDKSELDYQKKYTSLWQLAAKRGDSIMTLLERRLGADPKRLSMMGYGVPRPVTQKGVTDKKESFENRIDLVFVENDDPSRKINAREE